MDLPLFLTHPTPHKADTTLAEAITLGLYLENLNSATKRRKAFLIIEAEEKETNKARRGATVPDLLAAADRHPRHG